MYKHVHTALMAEGFWGTDTVTCNSVSSTLTLINVDVRNGVCVSVDDSLQSPVWLKLQLIKLNYWKKMEDWIARLIECWRPGGWEEEGNHSHSFIDIIYKKSVISSQEEMIFLTLILSLFRLYSFLFYFYSFCFVLFFIPFCFCCLRFLPFSGFSRRKGLCLIRSY